MMSLSEECINTIPNIRGYITEGDYLGDNGLLYCGRCHTPKELIVFGKTHYQLCNCELEKRNEKEAADKQKQFNISVSRLKQECFNNSSIRLSHTFEKDNGKQPKLSIAKAYCDNWDYNRRNNISLVFVGDVGSGKSYAAASIANELCGRGIPVKMINLSEAINNLTATFEKGKYIAELMSFALLIIDDFGIQRDTSFSHEQTFNIIENRINSGKPMIITTNIPLSTMRNETDITMKRIYDRVLMCTPVTFGGKSMRLENQREKRELFEAVLEK